MFKFQLGQQVQVVENGVTGKVISRTDQLDGECEYELDYVRVVGLRAKDWFRESALVVAAGPSQQ